eukprot:TRINITY_DN43932_c0_g1_i1.p2 TRINITY_DN43932_c0_g1~~TRINITY_DN43932_c0_g1_i1.p2  ORF type:complete len:257 (+),score=65.57 TRINITY_DN43932_c0_g1_i1:88-771(+)
MEHVDAGVAASVAVLTVSAVCGGGRAAELEYELLRALGAARWREEGLKEREEELCRRESEVAKREASVTEREAAVLRRERAAESALRRAAAHRRPSRSRTPDTGTHGWDALESELRRYVSVAGSGGGLLGLAAGLREMCKASDDAVKQAATEILALKPPRFAAASRSPQCRLSPVRAPPGQPVRAATPAEQWERLASASPSVSRFRSPPRHASVAAAPSPPPSPPPV